MHYITMPFVLEIGAIDVTSLALRCSSVIPCFCLEGNDRHSKVLHFVWSGVWTSYNLIFPLIQSPRASDNSLGSVDVT